MLIGLLVGLVVGGALGLVAGVLAASNRPDGADLVPDEAERARIAELTAEWRARAARSAGDRQVPPPSPTRADAPEVAEVETGWGWRRRSRQVDRGKPH